MGHDVLKELLGFRSELFGFIRAIVRNTHDAEDLFQEVARIILEKSAEGTQVSDFRAWAKEIARRQALQHYRTLRLRKADSIPTEEMADLVADVYMKHSPAARDLTEEYDALRQCMAKLPGKNVELIRLRFAADQGYDAIARAVQGSETAVRRMVARLRILLMDCVRRRLAVAGREA